MKLTDNLENIFRLKETQKKALSKLNLHTVEDLIYHFPARYGDPGEITNASNLIEKEKVVIYGIIKKIKTGKSFRTKIPMAEGIIDNNGSKVRAIWFNQPYIAKLFTEGTLVRLDGTVGKTNKAGIPSITNPKIEKVEQIPDEGIFQDQEDTTHHLYPVYPESKGITSNWIYHGVQKVLPEVIDEIQDSIPEDILKKYKLPNIKNALIYIHTPQKQSDALAARKRFAFEEILYIQINKQLGRKRIEHLESYPISKTKEEIKKFTDKFPFELTDSQKKANESILKDMSKDIPMSRLLEGDVGSGKTAVAATAVYATISSNTKDSKYKKLQAAYMVPTEILAKQHFENFIQFFKDSGVQIGLITGSGCYKFPSKVNGEEYTKISKPQLLKWIKEGQIPVVVGTHSLIQKTVEFDNLALVIIDEQHRFGTKQRQSITKKEGFAPHLLSMTATPIPRTLSLTIYGDLDLTLLDQMPTGRKPVITEIVTPSQRSKTYENIKKELESGRQVYVICPRIDEPDPDKQFALYAKSVKEESRRLNEEIFTEYTVQELHSKMRPAEKESIMKDFEDGKIDILVSTSVVEVGVNVPNATNIIIEGAERFGLSQLHQLRGRVIRSNHQAYCYIFTESKNEYTLDRLESLVKAKNGFELAEYDLKLRGSGELLGGKQWGITDIGMEAIKNIKMVEAAREEAKELVDKDPELDNYPTLKERISKQDEIHFE